MRKMERSILFVVLFAGVSVGVVLADVYYQSDLNGDGFVNYSDFTILAENWQKSGSGLAGDIDNSSAVNINDIAKLAENWLQYSLVIFVDANAPPGGDGSSWSSAFIYLQDAIAAAEEDYQIWIAQGIYLPDANSVLPGGTSFRTAAFRIPQGVSLYGGFPTGGCPQRQQRDWINNQTVLSGAIGTTFQSYNVVIGANDIVLDGFIISDANAKGTGDYARGGGMRNEDVNNLKITNCIFRNNYAKYDGGGIYNYQSSLTITNCIFSGNNCGDDGAGVYNSNSEPILISCDFNDNQADNRGGGIYNYKSGAELINCLFRNNYADANGGAAYNSYKTVKMTNCTIAENSATGGSSGTGGIYNSYSSSVITNCIVWNNGVEIFNKSNSPHISYCDIQGCGASGAGWDANCGTDDGNNIDSDPCFAGDLDLQSASFCIDVGKNSAVPLYITTDFAGNARFNGAVDIGAYEYGQLDITQDSDNDGLFDWWEYRYELNPNDANDAQNDIDDDGLSNLAEYNIGCDPIFFDTDGDLLPDGWEVLYCLNPKISDIIDVNDGNNVYADNDNDGLDAMAEIMYSCSPLAADTDSDSTNDGDEVSQGSLPNDASDNGLPPSADKICELRLIIGDWSNSNSERYDLVVGPITHQATQFGVVATADYKQFRPGNRYEIRVVHRGTNPNRTWYPNPDYDYVAQIEAVSLPAGVIMQIEDADGILGTHGEPNTINSVFDAEGKFAYVDLIKIQITEPDGNPITDNHFVFDSSSPSVCNVVAIGTTGIPQKNADLEWLLTAITGSTQTSNPTPPKGDSITFTYTGLPSSHSEFGLKTLTLTYPPTSQQTTKQVEIFFLKWTTNNPGMSLPNCFYYWCQTAATNGQNNIEYCSDTYHGGVHTAGYFDPVTPTKIHICGKSSDETGLYSIQNFSDTTIHEGTHRTHYNETNGSGAAPDTDGDWLKDSLETNDDLDLDGVIDQEPYTDTNGNGQYDAGETFQDTGLTRLELTLSEFNSGSPTRTVTYGAGDGLWTSEGPNIGSGRTSQYHANTNGGAYDDEDDACYATSGANATSEDWANPGSNSSN